MEPLHPGSGASVVESVLLVASFAPDGRVSHRDAAWAQFFGDQPEPWLRLVPEDQRAAEQFVLEAGKGILLTHQVLSAGLPERDEPTPVLLNFAPVFGMGTPPPVVAVSVTGEVLAEPTTWMIAQTRRHRLEAIGRMTMGIAHNFNNLLSGMLGNVEWLMENASTLPGAAPFRSHLDTVRRAVLDGADIVGKIQRFIRHEKQTDYEQLDLRELLGESLALTRPYWYNEPRRKGIQIELYSQLSAVPPVAGSGTELREVFVNLILNAVQAMPAGGRLRVACDYDGRAVNVVVEDTGTGMTDDVMARIFEPLFTTKGEQGTGMGLAVSYGIVQAHEGSMAVHSKPGRGSVFHIALPPAAAQESRRTEAPPETERRTARILVVDDEPMVSSILAKLLERRGHTVVTVEGGAQALERFGQESFDAVITDLGMPDMDGRALARRLRRDHPFLPILLLSGDTEPGAADETISEVLAKPARIERVDEALQRVLR